MQRTFFLREAPEPPVVLGRTRGGHGYIGLIYVGHNFCRTASSHSAYETATRLFECDCECGVETGMETGAETGAETGMETGMETGTETGMETIVAHTHYIII